MSNSMKTTIAAALISAAFALLACSQQPEPNASGPASQAAAEIEPIQLLPCPDPDVGRACEFDHVKAPEYLAGAMKGDYQAQRNMAALHSSAMRWNVARPVQACAWRMVIIVSKPADAEYMDADSYRIDCGALGATDLDASKRVADRIYMAVHGSGMPALPPIPA